MKDKFAGRGLVEIESSELSEISGGVALLPYLAYWILVDMAANPRKSYDAFMRGYNSW